MSVLSALALKLRITTRQPPALRLRAVVAQGPAGRPGPPGISAASLDYEQDAPALVWTTVQITTGINVAAAAIATTWTISVLR